MKTLAILSLALLSGCSSFKLGGMLYCPHGQACSFQQVPPQPTPPAPSKF